MTRKWLHSHQFYSPISGNQEVSVKGAVVHNQHHAAKTSKDAGRCMDDCELHITVSRPPLCRRALFEPFSSARAKNWPGVTTFDILHMGMWVRKGGGGSLLVAMAWSCTGHTQDVTVCLLLQISAFGDDSSSDGGDVWMVEWDTKAKHWKQDAKVGGTSS